MSVRRKAPSNLVPSASPRNSPPWLLHSTALSFSPRERRKESPELRNAGVYPLTWTKARKTLCRLHSDCTQLLAAWGRVTWASVPSGLDKIVNFLKQMKNRKTKKKIDVREGQARVCWRVREQMDVYLQIYECSLWQKSLTGVWNIKKTYLPAVMN